MNLGSSNSLKLLLTTVAVAVVAIALHPFHARGESAGKDNGSFDTEIIALRANGDYAAALELAQDKRAKFQEKGAELSIELADLDRLVATLQTILALPDSSRAAMARADSLMAAYDELHRDAQFEAAMAAAETALDIQTTYLGSDHYEVGLSMSRLAFAKHNLGDLAGAELIYAEALSIQRNSLGESHPDIAQTLNWMGVLFLRQGKYEQSGPLLHEALEMRRQFIDLSPGIANNLNDIGHLFWLQGNHIDAERIYKEAIEAWRQMGIDSELGYATSLDNLGVLYATQGRYAEAGPLYREALAWRRANLREDHPDVAVSLNNLGSLNLIMGDYAAAEPLFREALAIKRRTLPAGHQSLGLGLSNLAAILFKQGEVEEAEILFEEALTMFKNTLPAGHPYIALVLSNLATIASDQGHYARAESLQTEALSIYRGVGDGKNESVATVLNNIAKVKIEMGDYSGAETCLRDALEIYEHQFGGIHPNVADCRSNLGAFLNRRERRDEAEAELRRALAIYDELILDSSPSAVTSMSLLGSIRFQSGDVDAAVEILESACESFEVARRRVSVGGLGRASYLASESPYPRLAIAYLEQGDFLSAWVAVERDNGRSLLDILAKSSVRNLTDDEKAEERLLDRGLKQLEDAFVALAKDTTETGAAKRDSVRTVLLEAQSRWSQFQKQIADEYPIAEGQSYALTTIQSKLDEGCAILGWLDAEGSQFAYVIPDQGPVVWEELPTVQIDSLIHTYLTTVRINRLDSIDQHRLGQEIYNARIAPLEQHLSGVRRLIVIPSGPMLGIPIAALSDRNGQYVLDKWEVSYTSSATVFTWLVKKPKSSGAPSLFVLGDPPFNEQQARAMVTDEKPQELAADQTRSADSDATADGDPTEGLAPLSGSRKEVQDISKLFETSEVLLGEDASETNVVARATQDGYSDFRYLHFATHAIIDNKRAERSCLVLSQVDLPDPLESVIAGERLMDGRLTVDEVIRDWQLDADLVTLSACETALGREVRGEGYIGFAHAFFHAGARSVVVSLWKVDDRATRRLMVRFYENMLERGMTRSASLREAKRWLRDLEGRGGVTPFSHPSYWSGFILIGDPD
jgi:CHAT domain-containing protein/tetratricopeptide (TPR) repeat protein